MWPIINCVKLMSTNRSILGRLQVRRESNRFTNVVVVIRDIYGVMLLHGTSLLFCIVYLCECKKMGCTYRCWIWCLSVWKRHFLVCDLWNPKYSFVCHRQWIRKKNWRKILTLERLERSVCFRSMTVRYQVLDVYRPIVKRLKLRLPDNHFYLYIGF